MVGEKDRWAYALYSIVKYGMVPLADVKSCSRATLSPAAVLDSSSLYRRLSMAATKDSVDLQKHNHINLPVG